MSLEMRGLVYSGLPDSGANPMLLGEANIFLISTSSSTTFVSSVSTFPKRTECSCSKRNVAVWLSTIWLIISSSLLIRISCVSMVLSLNAFDSLRQLLNYFYA